MTKRNLNAYVQIFKTYQAGKDNIQSANKNQGKCIS